MANMTEAEFKAALAAIGDALRDLDHRVASPGAARPSPIVGEALHAIDVVVGNVVSEPAPAAPRQVIVAGTPEQAANTPGSPEYASTHPQG